MGEEVGNTAAVWVAAAFAVCTMKVLTAPGTAVGAEGVLAIAGMQAITKVTAPSQINNLLCINTCRRRLFDDDRDVWETHVAFSNPGHDMLTLFGRRNGVNDDGH